MERIDGDEELYRRIFGYQYVEDEDRIASSAFMRKNRLDPEVSVFLASLSDPREVLDAGAPHQRLTGLKAQIPYDVGLDVQRSPTDQFAGHCVIVGFGENWKEQCARLAEASYLISLP